MTAYVVQGFKVLHSVSLHRLSGKPAGSGQKVYLLPNQARALAGATCRIERS